jgi:hypothetical protein
VLLRSILILATLPAFAQIHVHATPESLSTNILGIKNTGSWNIGLTNMMQCAVTVSANMLMTALPKLHPINTARAKQLNRQAYNNSKRSKGIRFLNFIGPLAVAIVGGQLIKMTVDVALKATTATSLAVTAAQAYGSYLQSQQPDESLLDPNVPDVIKLAPFGQDGFSPPAFTLISGKIKNADTMDADIIYPVACPLVSTTPPKPTTALLECPPWIRSEICGLEMASVKDINADPIVNLSSALWGF